MIYIHPRTLKKQAQRYSSLEGQEELFSMIYRQRRRQKRDIYGRLLSERKLQTFELMIEAETSIFLHDLLAAADTGAPVNITPLCGSLVTISG
jgi:hypothetical protein